MDIKYTPIKVEEDRLSSRDSLSAAEADTLLGHSPPTPQRTFLQRWRRHALIHTCYITVYTLLTLLLTHLLTSHYHGPNLIFSPLRSAVTYEVHPGMDDYDTTSPYFGAPRPSLEKDWQELVQYTPIVLTEAEFATYRKEGIMLSDDSGYLSTITAYHDLHCVRYLHQTLYADVYFPNQTEAQRVERRDHSEHCLKSIKHGVMCHGDITVRTMKWQDDKLLPVATDNEHECVNWERIDEWMKGRSVEAWKGNLLIHPKLGMFCCGSRGGFGT